MEVTAKLHHRHQPLHLSVHHHRPSFTRPISSISFRTPKPQSLSLRLPLLVRASSSSSSPEPLLPKSNTPKPQFTFSVLKTTFVAAVAATAILFVRFNLKPYTAIAASPAPTVESDVKDAVSEEEKERNLEEYVNSHPDEVEALRNLMEVKVKSKKFDEAIGILDQLIRLEPEDVEWPLMKSHLYCYNGETEMAKLGFTAILNKDPVQVQAYHGLVMVASQDDSETELEAVEKKIGGAMEICKKENKKEELRDFKLLLAQIQVVLGNYDSALKVYQDLVKEEPRDFRPYLCQGIIYTLLRKHDEAEKQFEKYRRLVPKGHPYAEYFDDNVIATKIFGQKLENERAASKS